MIPSGEGLFIDARPTRAAGGPIPRHDDVEPMPHFPAFTILRAAALIALAAPLFPADTRASGHGALEWAAMDPVDLPAFRAIERPAPAAEISYGQDATQKIDLFLPEGAGPFPVVLLIHGGCWSARTAGREQVRHLGADLARRGIAVWSIGYRRADEAGGGYPGTYLDVATAIDRLRDQAGKFRLDLSHTVLVGHSAGGHLALWAAGRDRIPGESRLHAANPFVPRDVVALAGVGDLKKFSPLVPGICGQGIIESLLATPTQGRADVFADTSPADIGANHARVAMISGVLDRLVPPYVAHDYARSVRSDLEVDLINVEGAGHFDLVSTGRPGWEVAVASIESALARSDPPRHAMGSGASRRYAPHRVLRGGGTPGNSE